MLKCYICAPRMTKLFLHLCLGGVLEHKMDDNSEKPIAFLSNIVSCRKEIFSAGEAFPDMNTN